MACLVCYLSQGKAKQKHRTTFGYFSELFYGQSLQLLLQGDRYFKPVIHCNKKKNAEMQSSNTENRQQGSSGSPQVLTGNCQSQHSGGNVIKQKVWENVRLLLISVILVVHLYSVMCKGLILLNCPKQFPIGDHTESTMWMPQENLPRKPGWLAKPLSSLKEDTSSKSCLFCGEEESRKKKATNIR